MGPGRNGKIHIVTRPIFAHGAPAGYIASRNTCLHKTGASR
jgi:hypothetical protein